MKRSVAVPRTLIVDDDLRLRALLERYLSEQGVDARRAGEPQAEGKALGFGGFRLDLGTRRLTSGGELINLTTAELGLLSPLAQHAHATLSHDRFISMSHGRHREQAPFDLSIDVLVSRLRKIMEEDPAKPRYIQTVWGVGHVFVPDGGSP